jgi:nucleotide-binding universal stress UspA family protein
MQILAPTAGSVPAETNAGYIVRVAKYLEAELHVIHIIQTEEATPDGLKALEIFSQEGEKEGIKVKTEVVTGGVVEMILERAHAEDVELIVMGASHGVVVHEWLATNILNKSKIPVVIIPQGFDQIVVDV